MRRQSTLKSKGVETKTAADAGVDKTQFETPAAASKSPAKAAIVGKQESGCCTIF